MTQYNADVDETSFGVFAVDEQAGMVIGVEGLLERGGTLMKAWT